MNVVVVESPSKAKTINKYLGKDYTVLASFGHVRDLPSKDGSVRPDEDFAMVYETDADAKKHVSAIVKALKGAEALYLCTDPDREGEAISWHVLEALKDAKAIKKDLQIHRVTFDEITKKAILKAFEQPRDIDMNMVNAQQARRALDYLVGFTLSPVLWRKLPGSRSAGRVQSVALRLITQREIGFDTPSYASGLRAALRQDPDVILVGELRDLETIQLAMTAAETGHLVFATLHTTSAPKTIDRIIDVFPSGDKEMIGAMLATSLEAIVAQALLKKRDKTGRVAAHEIMLGIPSVRNLIREGMIAQMPSIMQMNARMGILNVKEWIIF